MRIASWATLAWLALSGCDAAGPQPAGSIPDPAALARGRLLFLEHCALCHGARGDGQGPRRGSLSRPPPDLRSPLWRSGQRPQQVRRAIRDGRPGTDMPPWQRLGEQALDDLTSYVLALGEDASGRAARD